MIIRIRLQIKNSWKISILYNFRSRIIPWSQLSGIFRSLASGVKPSTDWARGTDANASFEQDDNDDHKRRLLFNDDDDLYCTISAAYRCCSVMDSGFSSYKLTPHGRFRFRQLRSVIRTRFSREPCEFGSVRH